jgi:hypothetical protein
MDNFFNNGPKMLNLIVRVRIYHLRIDCNFCSVDEEIRFHNKGKVQEIGD